MRAIAVVTLLCGLAVSVEAQTTTLLGRVVSHGSNPEPIAGATVRVHTDREQVIVSDARGRFVLRDIPAGRVDVSVEMIGYHSRQEQISLQPGATSDVEIVLATQPVKLEPLAVTARSEWLMRNGFYERRYETGINGRYITSADIARRDPTFLTDLLRDMSGVKIHNAGIGRRVVRFNRTEMRGLTDRRPDNLPGCQPLLYLDGRQYIDSVERGWQRIDDFNVVTPAAIEAVEVYIGNAPPEFRNEGCGVILIWTKRGG